MFINKKFFLRSFSASAAFLAMTSFAELKANSTNLALSKNAKSISQTYSNKDGYLIVTTGDLATRLKSLNKFVDHKTKNRDFNVFVATEANFDKFDDPKVKKAVERGETKSRIRQYQLLSFLKAHYKKLNVKYVLFIGDSDPVKGDIPMIFVGHRHEKATDGAYVSHAWHSPSEYPYVDLDTDWDANDDGYFYLTKEDLESEVNKGTTREAEVFVGRVPYYGEKSKYGKAADIDVILDRFIRYDNEQDVTWRYNFFISKTENMGEARKQYEELGLNYRLANRHSRNYDYDFPGEQGANGGVSNWEKVSSFPTGVFGEYSHGGPFAMNGLGSRSIAKDPKDFYPSIMTLGACSIGQIDEQENLVYTLLRFNTVAASGGTRPVTSYGGNHRYVTQNKLSKSDLLFKGKSVGEAHWGWYGALYGKSMPRNTARRINLYGDPSVVPLRYGSQAPYPFIAKPVIGHYTTYRKGDALEQEITLTNQQDKALTVTLSADKPWLKLSQSKIVIPAKGQAKFTAKVTEQEWDATAQYQESRITLKAEGTKFSTQRRMGYYQVTAEPGALVNFEGNSLEHYVVANKLGNSSHAGGHNASKFNVSSSVERHMGNVNKYKDRVDKVHYDLTRLFDPVTGEKAEELKKHAAKEQEKLNSSLKRVSDPYVEGKTGTGYLLSVGLNLNMRVLRGEGFTFSFWIKDLKGKTLKDLFPGSPINFNFTDKEIYGALSDSNIFKDERISTNFKFQHSAKLANWNHLAFSLDQTTGQFKIILNGEKLGSVTVPKKKFYNFAGFRFNGRNNAVVDDIFFNVEPVSDKEVELQSKEQFTTTLSPKTLDDALPNKDIQLKSYPAAGLKGVKAIVESSDGKKIEVPVGTDGVAHITELPADKDYTWHLEYETIQGLKKSSPAQFSTQFEYFKNGGFEKDLVELEANDVSKVQKHDVAEGEKALILSRKKEVTFNLGKSPNSVDKVLRFKALVKNIPETHKANVWIGLYAGQSRILRQKVWMRPHDLHRQNSHKVDRIVELNEKHLNQDLKLTIGYHPVGAKDFEHKCLIDNLSLVQADKKAINKAPILIDSAQGKVFVYKKGATGAQFNIDGLFEDPEGEKLTVRLVSAPSWLILQTGDMMSPFGPPADAVGKEFDVVVEAKDASGNKAQHRIKVKATN